MLTAINYKASGVDCVLADMPIVTQLYCYSNSYSYVVKVLEQIMEGDLASTQLRYSYISKICHNKFIMWAMSVYKIHFVCKQSETSTDIEVPLI